MLCVLLFVHVLVLTADMIILCFFIYNLSLSYVINT